MRAAAPGKLILAGAWAVLEGAPAIVCGVDRFAYAADGEARGATAEVRAALSRPPAIDTRELEHEGTKLGLGSSAAALVAALALRAAERGEDVGTPAVRRAIFARAREVHAQVQGGGSGVDVAASTFGGVQRYVRDALPQPVSLPPSIVVSAFFSGTSARTSTLRERVEALRARDSKAHRACMDALSTTAEAASRAIDAADPHAFVDAIASSGAALAALGTAADAPIMTRAFAELGQAARQEGAAFIPSGAGGGDVGVFIGTTPASASFNQKALGSGMTPIRLGIDTRGVRITEGP